MKQPQIVMRYTLEFILAMMAYALALVASNSIIGLRLNATDPLRIPIALLPVIPVIFILHSILRVLMSSDELQQRIQLYAIALSASLTGLLTFSYGFLEGVGLPPLSMTWVFPIMIAFWGLSTVYFSRRYQ